ncbi:hypothetical protein BT93_F2436 [Corymbia citriodora subsp. variegata]|nr:hypothetical protein BT93_F2436 [Corymbia citriodora subsp. variegata]
MTQSQSFSSHVVLPLVVLVTNLAGTETNEDWAHLCKLSRLDSPLFGSEYYRSWVCKYFPNCPTI